MLIQDRHHEQLRIYAAPEDEEDYELAVMARALKDRILKELQGGLTFLRLR